MDNEDLRDELKSINERLNKAIHRENILKQNQNAFKQWLEEKNQIYLKQHGIVEPTITVREVIDKIREIEGN